MLLNRSEDCQNFFLQTLQCFPGTTFIKALQEAANLISQTDLI